MLTSEEFKRTMQRIYDTYEPEEGVNNKKYDPEMCHRAMDHMMAQLLCDLGYEDGIDIFRKAMRWYA